MQVQSTTCIQDVCKYVFIYEYSNMYINMYAYIQILCILTHGNSCILVPMAYIQGYRHQDRRVLVYKRLGRHMEG
jgi:hypothetical protein